MAEQHNLATIGVDVGTASVRAGLFDLTGTRLAMATEPIQIHRPMPEYAEQSSEEIWNAVGAVVRQVVQQANVPPEAVIGIGFDATCSLVVLDRADQPLSISPTGDPRWNIIMWMDHRATREAEEINAGGYEVLRYVGGVISPRNGDTQAALAQAPHAHCLRKRRQVPRLSRLPGLSQHREQHPQRLHKGVQVDLSGTRVALG
jgi:sugar (pentulose or hexulose) kinase